MVGKISTSPRYMIDITGTDPLNWGAGVSSEKFEKMTYF